MIYRVASAPMTDETAARRTGDFDADERKRLRMAHHRLRNASQAIESLLATEPLKGRWAPAPAPAEAVDGAKVELAEAYAAVVACHQDLSI
jgi:two-component sensor histidine kinase